MAEYEIEVKCKNCGKPISVLAPSRWGYKKRNRNSSWDYFCTWKCLREDEKKHEKKQKAAEEEKKTAAYRDREDEIRRLIRVVKDGGDPYEHLKGEGYANPKDTMRRLRLQAKDEYPELYTEIVALGLKDMRKGNGKKGEQTVINKMTPENKAKAIDIAIAGGDYIKHLKECGAGNPHASWSYIKQQLAREDPAKYDELMAALEKRKPEVIITKQIPYPASSKAIQKTKEEIYAELGVPAEAVRLDLSEHQPEPTVNYMDKIHEYDVADHPEKKPGTEVKTQVVLDSNGLHIKREKEALDYKVTAIKTKAGTFMISDDMKEITWFLDGKLAKLSVEKWTALAGTLEDTLRVLGVNI